MLRLNPLSTSKSRTPSMMNQKFILLVVIHQKVVLILQYKKYSKSENMVGSITCALRGLNAKLIGITEKCTETSISWHLINDLFIKHIISSESSPLRISQTSRTTPITNSPFGITTILIWLQQYFKRLVCKSMIGYFGFLFNFHSTRSLKYRRQLFCFDTRLMCRCRTHTRASSSSRVDTEDDSTVTLPQPRKMLRLARLIQ